jgi:hypothetical protein
LFQSIPPGQCLLSDVVLISVPRWFCRRSGGLFLAVSAAPLRIVYRTRRLLFFSAEFMPARRVAHPWSG